MAGCAFSVACNSGSGPSTISRPSGLSRRSSAWWRNATEPGSCSSRSRVIPTNWAPGPGNRKATVIAKDLVGLDDFAPVVVAAVPADRVRPLGLVALRAFDELHPLYRQVGPTLALAGMGITGLWKSHGQPIIRSERGGHAADAASWSATGSVTGQRKACLPKPS